MRIVVTRAAARAGPLRAALAAAGAEVVEMPATRIEPLDTSLLARAVARLGDYAWIVFTSQTAVELFWERLRQSGADGGALAGVRVAAVGPATASSLEKRGLEVTVSPERFVAEGLLEALRARDDVRGTRVLYATAEGARDVLPRGLTDLGATVDRIAIYRSVPDGAGAAVVREALERGEIDVVTFASASAVQGFVAAVGLDAARRVPAVSIGPVTTNAARAIGLDVAAEARESTIAGLVQAVIELGRDRRPERSEGTPISSS
jgi:uroporphyrinogen III methyltransferase/synthase